MTEAHAHSWTRGRLSTVLCALIAVVAVACGGESKAGPPEIHYGRDACDQCHMIISEARYAAAYRDRNGDPFVFDDIGDMALHATKAGVADSMTAWVHDYNTEKWIEAKPAWYVRSSIQTPMGHGIVAFGTDAAAQEFAAEHDGTVLRWAELMRQDGGDGTHPATSPPDHQMVTTTER